MTEVVLAGHSPLVRATGPLWLVGDAVLDLSGLTLATPFDLVGIASMLSTVSDPARLTVVPPADPSVANYLQRMDLFRHVPAGAHVVPPLRSELPRADAPVIEVTRIRDPDDVDSLAAAVVPRIRTVVSHLAWRALYDILVELGENAAVHGRSAAGAFIAAQYYSGRTSGMAEGFWIGVADAGVGIREHLRGRPEYFDLEDDALAIHLATQLWVTGTTEHRGIGLVTVRERAGAIAPGEVLIRSGTGEGHFFSRPSGTSTARYYEELPAIRGPGSTYWLGTGDLDGCGLRCYAFRNSVENGETRMRIHTFKVPGPVGATRERGRVLREELEALLLSVMPGDVVEIDVSEPQALSVSFTDELIGRVLAARAAGDFDDRALVIVGTSDDTRETVEAVLHRRSVPGIYRDDQTGKLVALGGAPWFAATLHEAQGLKTFRAAQLGDRLGLTPQAANNRLRALTTSGAVIRERVTPDRGGKEFEYRVAVS